MFVLSDFADGYRVPKIVADLALLEPFALSALNALMVGLATRNFKLPVLAFVVATVIGRAIGSLAASGLFEILLVSVRNMNLFQIVTFDSAMRLACCVGLSWIFCAIYPRTNTTSV